MMLARTSDRPADLLNGVPAIAAHLNMTRRQIYHLHECGELPTFKLGAKVCARRSTLAKHFAEQERAAAAPPPPPQPKPSPIVGDVPPLVRGHSAIAAYLDMRPRELTMLERVRAVPTYREGNTVVASAAALDDWRARRDRREA